MDTVVEITALGEDRDILEAAVTDAFSEMKRIEAGLSFYLGDSEVSRINRSAGIEPVEVDEETLGLIQESIRISELSGGAFDITFAPLKEMWNYKSPPKRLPTEEELKPYLARVGYNKIKVDPSGGRVYLERTGMRIDLGAIAKGYAVDRAILILEKAGVDKALVNAGGDLRVKGMVRGRAFQIGIQDPEDQSRILGKIRIEDKGVATSGDYERFFTLDGERYSHIIDPRTGFPAKGSRSVTVIADTSMYADALATAVFVLGPERGISLIESLQGVEGIIICETGERKTSSGLEGAVEWFNGEPAGSSAP